MIFTVPPTTPDIARDTLWNQMEPISANLPDDVLRMIPTPVSYWPCCQDNLEELLNDPMYLLQKYVPGTRLIISTMNGFQAYTFDQGDDKFGRPITLKRHRQQALHAPDIPPMIVDATQTTSGLL